MDEIENPYSPGAGVLPPALVGRERIIRDAQVSCERARRCYPVPATVVTGLRGVGKTAVLASIKADAHKGGLSAIHIQARADIPLLEALVPQLRSLLLKLPHPERSKPALAALAGMVGAQRLSIAGLNLEIAPSPGVADSGVLAEDLAVLIELVGAAVQAAETALVVLVDEMQHMRREEIAALGTALQRSGQMRLPLLFVGAGLPQVEGLLARSKGCSDRLFTTRLLDRLSDPDARAALERPAAARGVRYLPDAARAAVRRSQGYPYFIQELGKHVWDCAAASPISVEDVKAAAKAAIAALDSGFFALCLGHVTALETRYLQAMIEQGQPYRSGDIADRMGRSATALAPLRAALISKGLIYSPRHGELAFAIPMFEEFLRRRAAGGNPAR